MADRAFLRRLERELVDKGKIIEGGWVGYRLAVMPEVRSVETIEASKQAFHAGAMHLFVSMMNVLDPGEEPTERDLRRMALIQEEIDAFQQRFELQYGKTEGSA